MIGNKQDMLLHPFSLRYLQQEKGSINRQIILSASLKAMLMPSTKTTHWHHDEACHQINFSVNKLANAEKFEINLKNAIEASGS